MRYTATRTNLSREDGISSLPIAAPQLEMTRRDRDNYSFLLALQNRTATAWQNYFFSHGIAVGNNDFETAWEIPEHAIVLNEVSDKLHIISEAASLVADIGSLSLAEKEKAMRALYAVEHHFQMNHGDIDGIEEALSDIRKAIAAFPDRPSYAIFWITGTIAVIALLAGSQALAIPFIVPTCGAVLRARAYNRRVDVARAILAQAEHLYADLVVEEVTPLKELAI
ncbi:hypothetical protein ACQUFY_08280 [Robbsia andropogonis]|uniref:hypothetical protein n=1 Tax=Robbsia andropogonis TaxID=28092 RepID=UPI003D1E6811